MHAVIVPCYRIEESVSLAVARKFPAPQPKQLDMEVGANWAMHAWPYIYGWSKLDPKWPITMLLFAFAAHAIAAL